MLLSKAKGMPVVLLFCTLSACSSMNEPQMLSMMQGAKLQKKLDDRFQIVSVLNRSPKILIAKPKPKKRVRKKSGGSLFSRLIGGSQSRTSDGGYRQDPSARQEQAGANGFDSLFGKPNESSSQSQNEESDFAELYESDIVLPVASTAYGKDLTIIKSVNGGFGILLLNQGHHHNILACRALFQSLPVKSNKDIEASAHSQSGFFRPTYWLDRRETPNIANAERKTEFAQHNQLLHFASNNQANSDHVIKTKMVGKAGENCIQKLKFYNYSVSKTLIDRLELKGPGPFLAAWRDDAKKAMILDLSEFRNRKAHDKAMSVWIKLIVRHPELWKAGRVQTADFTKELGPVMKEQNKSIIALLSVGKEKR